jgi:hypothetical protein
MRNLFLFMCKLGALLQTCFPTVAKVPDPAILVYTTTPPTALLNNQQIGPSNPPEPTMYHSIFALRRQAPGAAASGRSKRRKLALSGSGDPFRFSADKTHSPFDVHAGLQFGSCGEIPSSRKRWRRRTRGRKQRAICGVIKISRALLKRARGDCAGREKVLWSAGPRFARVGD